MCEAQGYGTRHQVFSVTSTLTNNALPYLIKPHSPSPLIASLLSFSVFCQTHWRAHFLPQLIIIIPTLFWHYYSFFVLELDRLLETQSWSRVLPLCKSEKCTAWKFNAISGVKENYIHSYFIFSSYLVIKLVMDRSLGWGPESVARVCRSVADLSTQDRQFRATQPWPSGCPRNIPSFPPSVTLWTGGPHLPPLPTPPRYTPANNFPHLITQVMRVIYIHDVILARKGWWRAS